MPIRPWVILTVCTIFLVFSGDRVFSSETQKMMTGHAVYGQMSFPNPDSDLEGGDFEIYIFGGDGQKPLGGETLLYGFETGAFFSSDTDTRSMAASGGSGGGTVVVAVDVNSVMIDYFLGGYISLEPSKWFRLYAGAGPLLIWARYETKPEPDAPADITADTNSDWGAGLYARVGLDIFLTKQFGFSAGARATQTSLSFEDSTGEMNMEGYQYYGGIAFRF